MANHKIIQDDEIRYVPKDRLKEIQDEISWKTEFSVVQLKKSEEEPEKNKEEAKDIIDQIAESGDTEDEEENMSNKDFGNLMTEIKKKKLAELEAAKKDAMTIKNTEPANGIFGRVKLR